MWGALILFICINSVFSQPEPVDLRCRENEVLVDCVRTCQPTCDDPNGRRPCIIPIACTRGCQCLPGFVRNANGICVPISQCRLCPAPHTVFTDCGSACPRTCQNISRPPICPAVCVRRCVCVSGYIIDERTGQCILESQCPVDPACKDENEERLTCGTACPVTCQNRNDQPRLCPTICVAGCFCKPGFIRDTCTGRCVRVDQCPPRGFCVA